jgi:hypothetical protein
VSVKQWHGLPIPWINAAPSLRGAFGQYRFIASCTPSWCANLAEYGACLACEYDGRLIDAASIALDLAVSQAHRVTGGPHPRLLGLTDGPALAAYEGIAW